MSASVLAAAQNLDADTMVELWELDTGSLNNIFGISGTGSIYRWTPGVLNYRLEGTLLQTSSPQTVVLDRLINLPNTRLIYTLQVGNPAAEKSFSNPITISNVTTTTGIGNIQVTMLTLAAPLPQAATAGMPWLIESNGTVFFGGVQYLPAPIEVSDISWSGQGALPRPKLRISNIGGLAAALVIQFGDILGATVTRRVTFKSFLDGEATPDPSATWEPDVFVVDRKSAHNKTFLEFELAAKLDQQGIRLPRRLVLRDHCGHTYRQWTLTGGGHFVQGTCPYVDVRYYKIDGSAGFEPADDVCGKHLTDCLLRFAQANANTPLPFLGFPGVAEASR